MVERRCSVTAPTPSLARRRLSGTVSALRNATLINGFGSIQPNVRGFGRDIVLYVHRAPILFPRTMSRGIACVLLYHPLYSLSSVSTDLPYFVLLLGYRSGWLVRMRPTLARTHAGSLAAQYLFAVALACSRANNPSLFLLPRSSFL